MKYHIFLGLIAAVTAFPGIIHDESPQVEAKYDHQSLIGESGHHHQIEHEHAKSHQSIKFEHFHPVPVYVKKEHSHLLKHPLEKGKSEQNLKLIHPETEHKHGGGLVLEDDRHNIEHHIASAGLEHGSFEHGGLEQGLEHGGLEHGGYEHGGFEQGGYEHLSGGFKGYEGGEGLKTYAELQQPEDHGHYYAEHEQALSSDSGEGYKYESY
ncbi:uncharacterized protein LOC114246373 [Bombyx mandarina]|uniref:Uncharacterized protein LOC114246373 n=1 Tax=Bombyx mandarina TaxID=7092 RepID=A0A6J2K2Y1_BOMMA|nr:uncharacterized protein LOC114246373 [Bombyx mandarina]